MPETDADYLNLVFHFFIALGLPFGATIGGLVRNGNGMLVNGNSQIQAGDCVMVFCHEQNINQIEKLFKKSSLF